MKNDTILTLGLIGVGAYAVWKLLNNPVTEAKQESKIAVLEAAQPYKEQEAIIKEQADIQQKEKKLRKETEQTIRSGSRQETKTLKTELKQEAKREALIQNQPENIKRAVEYQNAFAKVFKPTAKVGYDRRQKLKKTTEKISAVATGGLSKLSSKVAIFVSKKLKKK